MYYFLLIYIVNVYITVECRALVKSNGPLKIKVLWCVHSDEEKQFLKEILKILIVMYENNFQDEHISTGTIFSKTMLAVILTTGVRTLMLDKMVWRRVILDPQTDPDGPSQVKEVIVKKILLSTFLMLA